MAVLVLVVDDDGAGLDVMLQLCLPSLLDGAQTIAVDRYKNVFIYSEPSTFLSLHHIYQFIHGHTMLLSSLNFH
jgi:hypothetical protein